MAVIVSQPALTNPMTTSQDLVVAGSAGSPGRLGVGQYGQGLGVNSSGTVAWVNQPGVTLAPSGDATGATDDANYYAAIGAVLQSQPGGAIYIPAGKYYTKGGWYVVCQPPAGFITGTLTAGSTSVTGITAGSGTNGIAIPTAGTVSRVFGEGIPVSGGSVTTDMTLTFGTPNTTGTLGAAATVSGTKTIWINTTSQQGQFGISLLGQGNPCLYPVGAAKTGIWMHHPGPGALDSNNLHPSPTITDIEIDGTNATGASVGIDVGDIHGGYLRLSVANFATTGAIGAQLCGRNGSWTEKSHFRIISLYNSTAIAINTTQTGHNSHEYNWFEFIVVMEQDQQGVVLSSVFIDGSTLWIQGNVAPSSAVSGNPTNNIALLSLLTSGGNGGTIGRCALYMKAEAQAGTGVMPWTIYSDAGASNAMISQAFGQIATACNGIKMNGNEFTFSGLIGSADYTGTRGDIYPSLTVPASGVDYKNQGPNAWVDVRGGTVTTIKLNGTTINGTSGTFYLPRKAIINVTYSSAPNWLVIPAEIQG